MMYKYLWIFLFFTVATTEAASTFTEIPDQAKVKILSPSFAERKTLKIRLPNGLEAYLVSDPHVEKSGATIGVKTGSWEDPTEYPGIAHFLEHMLFLGTKKYPAESDFDRYVTEHGGITNAYTTNDYTSYIFSIDSNAFPEALDRFASFFREPLFNPSGVSRELQAIDQEYAKNLDDDDFREMYVQKELADPNHPNHGFSMGNSATLIKVSREVLLDWYQKHYSANLMRLTVISSMPLEKLRDLVIGAFAEVPTSNKKLFSHTQRSLSGALDGKMVYITPVKNLRNLTIIWELPPEFADMRDTRPASIVCFVLGHEGKESLLAQLKREKLAETLKCGGVKLGPQVYQFYLEVGLTDHGIKEVDTVIMRTFQAIANFRGKGVPRYLFDEQQKLATIRYQYQQREDIFTTLMSHSSWMSDEEMSTFPEQTLILQKFDPKAVQELLKVLTPQNAHFDLIAPSSLTGIKPDRKEKWMGVPYAIQSIDPAKIEAWSQANPHPDIDIPPPNPFVPETLALIQSKEINTEIPHPTPILNNDFGLIYYAPDKRYLIPKTSFSFEIKTPQIESGVAAKMVLGDLFAKFLNEAVIDFSYDASMGGIDYEIKRTEYGIRIAIDGYSDKAPLFLKETLSRLKNLHFTEQKFEVYKSSLHRKYANAAKNSPLKQASEVLKNIVYKKYSLEKAKANATKSITFTQFQEFAKKIFVKAYVEGIIYGNLNQPQARELSDTLIATLGSQPYPLSQQKDPEIIVLPNDKGPFYLEQEIKVNGNAAILAVELGQITPRKRAVQQILMQAMSEPFFSDLRTKQQTGYIVFNTPDEVEKQLFCLFAVQSNTHEARDLLSRFELFIEGYLQEMPKGELPQERFENIKEALITSLRQGPRNPAEMRDLLETLAFKYNGDFDWVSKRLQAFSDLTYEEFLPEAVQLLGRRNKRRLAVLMSGIIPEDNIFNYMKIESASALRKMSTYITP